MNSLEEVYEKYKVDSDSGGGDKGTVHDYIRIYSDYINKNNCERLLEIGVHKGYSIKMWEEYLSESEIVGVDINLSQCQFSFDRARLIQCDATSKDLLDIIKGETFDVIIDDGSHKLQHQIKSFELLLPVLNKGGRYFIEDIISGNGEKSLLNYLDSCKVKYKLFRPIETSGRYDDIIIVIFK
jgi:23S rRNA U2552 (ribose-2'-O)-methylase RlmE/FtsJ